MDQRCCDVATLALLVCTFAYLLVSAATWTGQDRQYAALIDYFDGKHADDPDTSAGLNMLAEFVRRSNAEYRAQLDAIQHEFDAKSAAIAADRAAKRESIDAYYAGKVDAINQRADAFVWRHSAGARISFEPLDGFFLQHVWFEEPNTVLDLAIDVVTAAVLHELEPSRWDKQTCAVHYIRVAIDSDGRFDDRALMSRVQANIDARMLGVKASLLQIEYRVNDLTAAMELTAVLELVMSSDA